MRGSIGFAHMESTGEFDARIDGPGGIAPIIPAEWRPTGSIAATGSWSGRLHRPRVSARLTGEELFANGLHFESLAGDVEVVDDELLVHDVRLSQPNGQLRVDGRYNIRERALSTTTVEGRGLRVTLRRLWSPAGDDPPVADANLERVSVDMRLEGSVLRPSGEGSLTADSVRLSGRDAGAVVARAHAAQGQVPPQLGAPHFSERKRRRCRARIAAALDRTGDAEWRRCRSGPDASGPEPEPWLAARRRCRHLAGRAGISRRVRSRT